MKAIHAFLHSFRGRTASVSLYAWMANLFFSLLAYLGLNRLLACTLGDSLLLENSQLYGSFSVWMEMIRHGEAGMRLLLFELGLLALVFGLFSVFLSGGIYGCFISGKSTGLRDFLRQGWNAFPGFIKLFFTCWLVWIPALAVCLVGFLLLAGVLRDSGNETAFRWLAVVWGGLTLLLAGYSLAVYDFARIQRLGGVKKTWESFRAGMGFVSRHAGAILLLYILFLVPFLLLFPLTSVLDSFTTSLPLIPLLLVFQVAIWLRYFLKTVLMHAETRLVFSQSPVASGGS